MCGCKKGREAQSELGPGKVGTRGRSEPTWQKVFEERWEESESEREEETLCILMASRKSASRSSLTDCSKVSPTRICEDTTPATTSARVRTHMAPRCKPAEGGVCDLFPQLIWRIAQGRAGGRMHPSITTTTCPSLRGPS